MYFLVTLQMQVKISNTVNSLLIIIMHCTVFTNDKELQGASSTKKMIINIIIHYINGRDKVLAKGFPA